MPSSIFAAIIAAIPVFEGLVGMPIVVADSRTVSFDTQYQLRDEVCEKLGMSDCSTISPGSFMLSSLPDGNSYTMRVPHGDGGGSSSACIVTPPAEGFVPFASYVRMHTGYSFNYDDYGPLYKEQDDEEMRTYNFLLQLSKCGRDGSLDANLQSERDLAFASIATTLIHGNKDFLSFGGNTTSAMYATGLNSEAGRYGTAVAERILLEDFKQQLGAMLGNVRGASASGPCRINVETDNQPRLPVYLGQVYNDDGSFQKCVTDERGRSSFRIVVNDELLYSIAPRFDEDAQAETGGRGEENVQNFRRYTGYIESLSWSPFKNFGGSFQRGIPYAWQTANQIVGIY